jgi:glycosyltransferase involved in cell wall biosynthesis
MTVRPSHAPLTYALITGAFNEEQYIGDTIRAVVAQTHQPVRWVIADDASSDRTPTIIRQYALRYPFICLHRLTEPHSRNFTAHVVALNAAHKQLGDIEYDLIGNLDGDVSFAPDYFARLVAHFAAEPALGIGGGCLHEKSRCSWQRVSRNEQSVPNAIQLFRRECYDTLGGYRPLKYGAPDTYAEVSARMKGWRTQCFGDLVVYHHRACGGASGRLRNMFRQGLVAYSLGSHPLFEALKSVDRLRSHPRLLGSVWRMAGFLSGYLTRQPREASDEFATFLREEQCTFLRTMLLGTRARFSATMSRERTR